MSKKHIYISIDCETDGSEGGPGKHSMLQLGAVAIDPSRPQGQEVFSAFEVRLYPLEEAREDPATMNWWCQQPPWSLTQVLAEPRHQPNQAMTLFRDWVGSCCEEATPSSGVVQPMLVAYPIAFDWEWLLYYLRHFPTPDNPISPFGWPPRAIDLGSYAAGVLGLESTPGMARMPTQWLPKVPANVHHALADAYEQGLVFLSALRGGQQNLEVLRCIQKAAQDVKNDRRGG